jgi:hypothetical protein
MMDQKAHSLLTTTSGRQHYLADPPAHVDKLINERRTAAKNAELNLSQLVSLPLHGRWDSNVLIRVYNVESIEPFYDETKLT